MVEMITYEGKQYPIRVSYNCLVMTLAETGLNMEDLDNNLEAMQTVIWHALESGARITKQPHGLKREDMIWVLDEAYIEVQKALFRYAKSIVKMQEDLLNEDEEAGKKK